MAEPSLYISITGLRLKRPWHLIRFSWHAVRSLRQAKRAPGNLRAQARTINGIRHTLSVWQSEAAMRAFVHSGAHKRAIGAFGSIATGKTFGFETDTVPDWDEVHDLWRARGREYQNGPGGLPPRDRRVRSGKRPGTPGA